MLVAPLVDQLNVLLEPEAILAGFAANELIVGLLCAFTVIVTVAVTDKVAFVAVSVYVVVAVGLTLVVPVAEVEVRFPGEMLMLVALLVDQLNVLLSPALTLVGLAANEAIVGADPPGGSLDPTVPQPANPAQLHSAKSAKANTLGNNREGRESSVDRLHNAAFFPRDTLSGSMRNPRCCLATSV